MAEDVKKLLLQIDASVELLRKNLAQGEKKVSDFERFVNDRARKIDKSFSGLGRGITGVNASIGDMNGKLLALGGTLTAAFSGRELIGFLDSFTRLQNNLRVAGVEGENLKAVQDRLLESAQKYGVSIESLSALFGKATTAPSAFGASQAEVFELTDAVSASLKIQGTSAEEAQGALLQLAQALQSGTVRAEEFNSINEGMFPLLQAAAAGSERWGGSVAKLRADVLAGKVSSEEFFNAILRGSDTLDGRATKATLTLAGGFTTLTNALTVYFGEADKANGISAALGEALSLLAENLDTIIPALTVIVGILGVRFVVAATAAAASALLTSNAMIALSARMAGAATTAEALSLALAGIGPTAVISAAVLALGGAFYYTEQRMRAATEATGAYTSSLEAAKASSLAAASLASKIATAKGAEREQWLAAARAIQYYLQWMQAAAKAQLAQAEAQRNQARSDYDRGRASRTPAVGGGIRGGDLAQAAREQAARQQAENNFNTASEAYSQRSAALDSINSAIAGVGSAPAAGGTGGGSGKGRGGRSGASAGDVARRFDAERAQLAQQALQAQLSMTASAEERAELETRSLELTRIRAIADIKANEDYSKAQKEVLIDQVERLAEIERDRVAREQARQSEQDALALADTTFQAKMDELRQQYDLTDSRTEQARLAQEMITVELAHLRASEQAVLASQTATDAEKRRAQVILDSIGRLEAGRREQAARQTEGAGASYLRELNREAINIGDAFEEAAVRGIDRINEGLSNSVKKALGLHGVLGDIVGDFIEIAIRQALIRPLAESLFGGSGSGGGGLFGSLLGGLFGGFFAEGGEPPMGKVSVVGEKGPELFVPKIPGRVLSNQASLAALAASGGGGSGGVSVTINAPGATAETVAMIRREITAAAPRIVEASRQVTTRSLNRPRLP